MVEILGVIYAKHPLYISGTVFGFLEGLLRVITHSENMGGIDRDTRCLAQCACYPLRLIVPAFTQTVRMEGYRYDIVDVVEESGLQEVGGRFRRKVVGNLWLLVKFYLMDQVLHIGTLVEKQERRSPLKSGQIGKKHLRLIATQHRLFGAWQTPHTLRTERDMLVL